MMWFDAVTPWQLDSASGNVSSGMGTAGTTRFSIDPDQAQKMITGLEQAVEKLRGLRLDAENLEFMGAPGPDPYSGYATLAMRDAAGNKEGGYGWANQKAIDALEKTIESIKTNLANYRQTDDAAETAMGR